MLIAAIGILLAVVVYVLLEYRSAYKTENRPVDNSMSRQAGDPPSEDIPGDDYEWRGTPNEPKKISIPSLGIDAFVEKVGVDRYNEVAVPKNIHIAGWFTNSVRPGERGLSIIDGHTDGIVPKTAVFTQLGQVSVGTEIVIVLGSGETLSFTVFDTTETTTEEAAAALFSQDPTVSHQLNLITCTGNYDNQKTTYDKRVIVSAALAQ